MATKKVMLALTVALLGGAATARGVPRGTLQSEVLGHGDVDARRYEP